MNRQELYEKYAQAVVDGLDIGDLMEIVMDNIISGLNDLPESDALGEIEAHQPELLEGYEEPAQ